MNTLNRLCLGVAALAIASFAAAQHHDSNRSRDRHHGGYSNRNSHRSHSLNLGLIRIDLKPPGHSRRNNGYYNDRYRNDRYYDDRYYDDRHYDDRNYRDSRRHSRNCDCHDCRH